MDNLSKTEYFAIEILKITIPIIGYVTVFQDKDSKEIQKQLAKEAYQMAATLEQALIEGKEQMWKQFEMKGEIVDLSA